VTLVFFKLSGYTVVVKDKKKVEGMVNEIFD